MLLKQRLYSCILHTMVVSAPDHWGRPRPRFPPHLSHRWAASANHLVRLKEQHRGNGEANVGSSERQERTACVKARPGAPGHLPRVPFWVEEIARASAPRALLGSQDLRRARLARHVEPTIDVVACRYHHGQGDASKLLRGPRTRRGNLREGVVQGPERQESAARLKPEIIVHCRHRILPA